MLHNVQVDLAVVVSVVGGSEKLLYGDGKILKTTADGTPLQ